MFFLLYGEDTFRSRQKLSAMRERFSSTRDASGLNASMISAKGADMDEIAASFFASPFLADRKLMIFDGFLRASASVQERMKDMLERKPESTSAIFYEDTGAEDLTKSPLFALMQAQKFTEECTKMGGASLERFAIDECAARGVTLPPRSARTLVGIVGEDSWLIHEEIEKLCAYTQALGTTTVTDAMLDTLVPGMREESLFALIDACTEGRCTDAAMMLERLLDTGTSALQVVSMLEKHYRTMIAVSDLVARGESDKNVVAKRVGIHPFPASKAINAVRRHSPALLRRRYDELLEIERKIKTSAGQPNVLLGIWLVKTAA